MNLRIFVVGLMLSVVSPSGAVANDRLPKRLQKPFTIAMGEARAYANYILEKVWKPKIAELQAKEKDPKKLRDLTYDMVDEIIHIVLPYGKKLVDDVVFGTGSTHLKITMPERGYKLEKKLGAMGRGLAASEGGGAGGGLGVGGSNPGEIVKDAIMQVGGAQEREMNDRLEQALLEDWEDHVQREVEGRLGLSVEGRPRNWTRPLTSQYEGVYAGKGMSREEVHRFTYWWLRKKQRLQLAYMGTTMSHEQLDAARDKGDVWSLTSAISHEAWAQNRLRMDFKWGWFNWEVDRRRIRRRMDQDTAAATWALAKLVKELSGPETQKEAERFMNDRLAKMFEKGELRKKAEAYPQTSKELQDETKKVLDEAKPIFDKAMDKVKLPDDMNELAREHGRRYIKEEMSTEHVRAVQRQAAPYAAIRRVNDKLKGWIDDAMAKNDPGAMTGREGEATRARVVEQVKAEVKPLVEDEIETSLRDAGLEEAVLDKKTRDAEVKKIYDRFGVEKMIRKDVEKRLAK